MASERSLQLAAQAWCGEKTSSKEMDTDLATAFAEILDKEVPPLRAAPRKPLAVPIMVKGRQGIWYHDVPEAGP